MRRTACNTSFFLVLALTITLASGMLFGTARAEKAPEQVVIGFQAIPNAEIIAKDLKWQEETLGAPIKWVQIESGRDANTAMLAGSIDIGLAGSSPVAAGIALGIPYEVIWIHDIIGDNEALVARKKSGVEKVEDLAGKKVAVPFGSTTHYHLLVALKVFNVDQSKVTILDMQPSDMLAAWQRGDIDAGFVWEPTLDKMIELGGKRILSSRVLAEKGYLTGDLCVVRKAFAKKYPELVKKYLRNLNRGIVFYNEHPEQAAAAVAKQFSIKPEEALRQMKSLILLTGQQQLTPSYLGTAAKPGALAKVLKDSADFLAGQKLIKSSPDLPVFVEAVNTTYLEEALK